jgi:hypothetical protein
MKDLIMPLLHAIMFIIVGFIIGSVVCGIDRVDVLSGSNIRIGMKHFQCKELRGK